MYHTPFSFMGTYSPPPQPQEHRGMGALGDAQQAQIASVVGSTVATTAAIPAVGGALLGALGIGSWAIPIVGPIIAGITFGVSALLNRKGAQQKVISSQEADKIEPYMKQNLAAWEASTKYKSQQEACLENFDALWKAASDFWSNPELGEPGKRAIQERGPTGTPSWGKNWFQLYRDPIANDPGVKPDPASVEGIQGVIAGAGLDLQMILIIALVAGAFFIKD